MRPTVLTTLIAAATMIAGCGEDGDIAGSTTASSPTVVAMSPAPGQEYVADTQAYAVEFSHAMDHASVEEAYRVMGPAGAVSGTYHWSESGRAFAFYPAAQPSPDQQIQISLGEGMHTREGAVLEDEAGAPLGPFQFTCTVYATPQSFESNGQQIYFTGTSPSGEPIEYSMGPLSDAQTAVGYHPMGDDLVSMGPAAMGGGMGSGMMGSRRSVVQSMTCASCHGADGSGGRYLAMGSVRTPSIQHDALASPGDGTDDGDHDDHPPYDDESLKGAIAAGVDPAGEPLDGFMPRWSMSEADLADLVEFLKTL